MKLGRVRLGFIAVIAAIVVAALTLPDILSATYLRSKNAIWHWRHHDRLQVQSYEILVPRKWFVSEFANSLMLTDLTTGQGQIAVITIRQNKKPFNLEQQKQMETFLTQKTQKLSAPWTEVRVGPESIFCHELNVAEAPNISVIGKPCHLQSLEITFAGTRSQLPSFEEFLKGIKQAH